MMDLRPISISTVLFFMVFFLWTTICSDYDSIPVRGPLSYLYHTDPAITVWDALRYEIPKEGNPDIPLMFCKGPASENRIVFYNNDEPSCTFIVELAVTEYEQTKGLMFRKALPLRNGMLFIYNDEDFRYYWMKNTYIPLDLVFIDSHHRVVDVFKNARPLDETTIASKAKARFVLEINAGQADRCKIKKGTRVKFNIF